MPTPVDAGAPKGARFGHHRRLAKFGSPERSGEGGRARAEDDQIKLISHESNPSLLSSVNDAMPPATRGEREGGTCPEVVFPYRRLWSGQQAEVGRSPPTPRPGGTRKRPPTARGPNGFFGCRYHDQRTLTFIGTSFLCFSLLGEVQVNGKTAVGVKISKEGKKELDFYFDKQTNLLAKTVLRHSCGADIPVCH